MKKVYGYDVYYRLATSSSLLVAAHSVKEAKEKALEQLEEMSKEEIIERFLAALNFDPTFQVTFVEKVDELEEE